MKEMWEKPRIAVEEFVANEYCTSVCYKIGCGSGAEGSTMPDKINPITGVAFTSEDLWGDYADGKVGSDWWNTTYYNIQTNHAGDCSNPDKNAVWIDDNNNVVVKENTQKQPNLETKLLKTFDMDKNGKLGVGDLFAWVTIGHNNYSDNRIWLHWAFATEVFGGHPNRS